MNTPLPLTLYTLKRPDKANLELVIGWVSPFDQRKVAY